MKEPVGMIDRLREGRLDASDIQYIGHRLATSTNRTEIKLLQGLRARLGGMENEPR